MEQRRRLLILGTRNERRMLFERAADGLMSRAQPVLLGPQWPRSDVNAVLAASVRRFERAPAELDIANELLC
jgi:hypothetical protein